MSKKPRWAAIPPEEIKKIEKNEKKKK